MRADRDRPARVLYLVSHPIQYQAPLLARLEAEPGLDLTVGFTERASASAYDPGFRRHVEYDTPLLEGYRSQRARRRDLPALARESDAVWSHGWAGSHLLAIVIARALGRPVLMRSETWEGAYGPTTRRRAVARRWLHRAVDRLVDAHLTIGSLNQSYWRAIGATDERLVHVPYAVDNERFASGRLDRDRERCTLGVGPSTSLILFAGKLSERKHPDVLAAAFRRLRADGRDAVLVVAGDGPLRQRVDDLVGGRDDVRLLGFVNQSRLPALYAAADVFVLAASNEPWGLAVNEAMAAGTAVVVSDQVGAAADLVDDAVGRVVPSGCVTALHVALGEVLDDAVGLGDTAAERVASWSYDDDVAGLLAAIDVVRELAGVRR